MADIILSQAEGDKLLAMNKIPKQENTFYLPNFGGTLDIQLRSEDEREEFVLNYTKCSINLTNVIIILEEEKLSV